MNSQYQGTGPNEHRELCLHMAMRALATFICLEALQGETTWMTEDQQREAINHIAQRVVAGALEIERVRSQLR